MLWLLTLATSQYFFNHHYYSRRQTNYKFRSCAWRFRLTLTWKSNIYVSLLDQFSQALCWVASTISTDMPENSCLASRNTKLHQPKRQANSGPCLQMQSTVGASEEEENIRRRGISPTCSLISRIFYSETLGYGNIFIFNPSIWFSRLNLPNGFLSFCSFDIHSFQNLTTYCAKWYRFVCSESHQMNWHTPKSCVRADPSLLTSSLFTCNTTHAFRPL